MRFENASLRNKRLKFFSSQVCRFIKISEKIKGPEKGSFLSVSEKILRLMKSLRRKYAGLIITPLNKLAQRGNMYPGIRVVFTTNQCGQEFRKKAGK